MRNSKRNAILSYVTWIGWIFVYLTRNRKDQLVRRHLNQALVLNVLETVGGICARLGGFLRPVGTVIAIGGFILLVMGIARAMKMSDEPLPRAFPSETDHGGTLVFYCRSYCFLSLLSPLLRKTVSFAEQTLSARQSTQLSL